MAQLWFISTNDDSTPRLLNQGFWDSWFSYCCGCKLKFGSIIESFDRSWLSVVYSRAVYKLALNLNLFKFKSLCVLWVRLQSESVYFKLNLKRTPEPEETSLKSEELQPKQAAQVSATSFTSPWPYKPWLASLNDGVRSFNNQRGDLTIIRRDYLIYGGVVVLNLVPRGFKERQISIRWQTSPTNNSSH